MKKYSHYILKNRVPVPVTNISDWLEWISSNITQGTVAKSNFNSIKIATVFLGIDIDSSLDSPMLFETLILGGQNCGYSRKYATWKEAEDGHRRAVNLILTELH